EVEAARYGPAGSGGEPGGALRRNHAGDPRGDAGAVEDLRDDAAGPRRDHLLPELRGLHVGGGEVGAALAQPFIGEEEEQLVPEHRTADAGDELAQQLLHADVG